jgi:hypothetical protein
MFPADAIARAKHYLSMAPGGLGNAEYMFLFIQLKKRGIFLV